MRRQATMHDVARLAAVNQSTVSRVLGSGKGRSRISEQVKRRVLRAAERLGYRINPVAVSLRTGATRTALVVVSDITDTYYGPIISGIESVLVEQGWSVLLHSLRNAGEPRPIPELVRRHHAGGALMLGALPGVTDQMLLELGGDATPTVLIGRSIARRGLPSVTVDNRLGGRLAGEHLRVLGHRSVVAMRGPRGWPDFPARLAAFRAALRQGPVSSAVAVVPCRSRDPVSGYEAAKAALAADSPTAIFCLNDATAIGALRAVRETGRRIPADVSVIGFDDGEFAEVSCPPLTTVRQPRYEMGQAGARMLMALKRGDTGVDPMVLPVELVVRESTCPARRS